MPFTYTVDPTNVNQPDPNTVRPVALASEIKALKAHLPDKYVTKVQLAAFALPSIAISQAAATNAGLSVSSDGVNVDYRLSAPDALAILRVFGVTP